MTGYLRGSMAATDRWPNNIALCKWFETERGTGRS